jgi:diguanylate cyclase (GGDEF)-like protein
MANRLPRCPPESVPVVTQSIKQSSQSYAGGRRWTTHVTVTFPSSPVDSGALLYGVSMSSFSDDTAVLRAAYVATRNILHTRDALAAQQVVLTLCRALGAEVAAADLDLPDSVPMDMSLGEGEPLLPVTSDPRVRALLTRYLVAAVSDARLVVERGRISEQLVQMATIDVLTGVWSRRSLTLAINHARSGDCVALIDLDHFKAVNDTLGHDAGDTVLATFAAHLRAGVRDQDIVGRFGGEEFVVMFPATTPGTAYDILNRLRGSWLVSSLIPITFSAGIAVVAEGDRHGRGGPIALKDADALMYEAKAAGRDRMRCRPTTPQGGVEGGRGVTSSDALGDL